MRLTSSHKSYVSSNYQHFHGFNEFSQSDITVTDIRNVLLAELTASLLGGLACECVWSQLV